MSIAQPPSEEQNQLALTTKGEDLQYNAHLENLIAAEAEKSLVLRWLHDQSEKRYAQYNTYIAIPVIVISTLAGTASIGQTTLFGKSESAPIAIGMLSLVVSVLNVISNFFGWAKRSEGHRISGINYGKLHRWIAIELALPRDQRVPAKHFLKEIRSQVDRLNETSPPIPQAVVDKFQKNMRNNLKNNISVPEICNDIQNVEIYRGTNRDDTFENLSVVGDSIGIDEEQEQKDEETKVEMTNPMHNQTNSVVIKKSTARSSTRSSIQSSR